MARDGKLIGYYGKLAQATTTEVTTGLLTSGVIYVVKTIGGSSAIPAGVEVGKSFIADGTEDITASGDVVIALAETDKCDISTWSIDLSRPEIDVTTLCDEINTYLPGRPDLSGTIEGIYKTGTTDANDGVLNAFVDIVAQAGEGGAITVYDQTDGALVFVLYKQERGESGDVKTLYVAPVVLTSYSDSVSGTDGQAFSSGFRIAPSDDIKFHALVVTYP